MKANPNRVRLSHRGSSAESESSGNQPPAAVESVEEARLLHSMGQQARKRDLDCLLIRFIEKLDALLPPQRQASLCLAIASLDAVHASYEHGHCCGRLLAAVRTEHYADDIRRGRRVRDGKAGVR